jgi:hypothetical protein
MNQRDRLVKAINLIAPVEKSVASRRPAGMSAAQADRTQMLLVTAGKYLMDALAQYDNVQERRVANG